MAKFALSVASQNKLKNVHPDLIAVIKRALELTSIDFSVTDGLRTIEQEREHINNGTSNTMNSRHLTGHAVDLTPWFNGASVNGRDPANWHYFVSVSRAMKLAAMELKTPVEWGGDWPEVKGKSTRDGYHFELTWKAYPLK